MNARQVLIVAAVVLMAGTVLRWQVVSRADAVQAARVHGEQVFRLQNAVVNQLIDVSESGAIYSARDSAALLAAEDRIVLDCRHLNEAASLSAGGGGPDLQLQLRVLASLEACEESALALRSRIDKGGTELHVSLP